MLGPDEQFTIQSLSGDVPKRPHVIKSLCLLLGPDFMTDVVVVETSDHARLSLKLSYNWHFEYDAQDAEKSAAIFSVPDFVGDACKDIASRVRGIVAAHSFDNFHKGRLILFVKPFLESIKRVNPVIALSLVLTTWLLQISISNP
jgi:major vault protein